MAAILSNSVPALAVNSRVLLIMSGEVVCASSARVRLENRNVLPACEGWSRIFHGGKRKERDTYARSKGMSLWAKGFPLDSRKVVQLPLIGGACNYGLD